jgi:hypothetical protein
LRTEQSGTFPVGVFYPELLFFKYINNFFHPRYYFYHLELLFPYGYNSSLNPDDANALEEALKIKDKNPGHHRRKKAR